MLPEDGIGPEVTAEATKVLARGLKGGVRKQLEAPDRSSLTDPAANESCPPAASHRLASASVSSTIARPDSRGCRLARRTRRPKTTRSGRRRTAGPEWVGGWLEPPIFLTDRDQPSRPCFVLWLDVSSGEIVGQDVVAPEEAHEALTTSLLEAIDAPLAGAPRRPARVRVCDPLQAEAVRSALSGRAQVEVAPTPELDLLFQELLAALTDDNGDDDEVEQKSLAAASLLLHVLPAVALAQPPVQGGSAAAIGRRQTVERFVGTRPAQQLEANYLLFLPASYRADEQKRWPLIVHLHGGGGRGTDPERLRHYPLVQWLEREPDFPFVVVTPQCPYGGRDDELGDTWVEHAELVLAVVDEVIERHRIDPDRVSLVGHSMGGNGAWYLGHRAPERWAAIVPMSAPAVTWWAYRIAEDKVPTWVFHGDLDEAVPVAESERMVEAMERFDGEARFTRYPEGGHAIREPFDGEELYDWLLVQDRAPGALASPDGGAHR